MHSHAVTYVLFDWAKQVTYGQKSYCRGVQFYPTLCLGRGECLWRAPMTLSVTKAVKYFVPPLRYEFPESKDHIILILISPA